MVYTSKSQATSFSSKYYTWTCANLLKILLFTLTLTVTPTKTAAARGKNDDDTTVKRQICYSNYGCFKNEPPFNPRMPLPDSPQNMGVMFLLRTRLSGKPENITNVLDIKTSTFDGSRPTKVLIHGYKFMGKSLASWVPRMADAVLKKEDVNVIMVDWVKGAAVFYDNAVSNTRMVGVIINKYLKNLMKHHGMKHQDVHLIGFSLGAHVTGFVGKAFKDDGGKKYGRISALDPAKPGFTSDNTATHLCKEDASFVDVIHTDTKTLLHYASGMNKSIGHVDFWPNGGADQPNCHKWDQGYVKGTVDMAICDHLRAPDLYIDSITGELPMIGYRCPSYAAFKRGACLNCRGPVGKDNNRCNVMGYYAKKPHGIEKAKENDINYFLDTSGEQPNFAQRHYQVKIHWRELEGVTTVDGVRAKLFARLHGEHMDSSYVQLYHNADKHYHVFAGRTSRFSFATPYDQDLGVIKRISFWWSHEVCWHYYACNYGPEQLYVKRIKLLDAVTQKKYLFISRERLEGKRVAATEILPKDHYYFYNARSSHQFDDGKIIKSPHRSHLKHKNLNAPVTSATSLVQPLMRIVGGQAATAA